jgi:hypothetical protein
MTPLHPSKDLIKIKMKKKMSNMIKSKRRAMIKRMMMMMMGIIEKHHHILEYATIFKEITPLTTYLMILRKG